MFYVSLLIVTATFCSCSVAFTVKESDIKYYLFTKNDTRNSIPVQQDTVSKYLDPDAEIVFLIHGWTENHSVKWYTGITEGLFKKNPNYNIIQVDWSKQAITLLGLAAHNTKPVANIFGKLVTNLVKHGFKLSKMTFIGHSYGAQISGLVGKIVQKAFSQNIKTIIALDNGAPYFSGPLVPDSERLDKNDADVVVCIHTDMGFFGYSDRCGTTDIYVNGGSRIQPGCPEIEQGYGITEFIACSHMRSHQFYEDGLRYPGTLIATRCESYNKFKDGGCKGNKQIDIVGDITIEDSGTFHMKTNAHSPYGRGP